MPFVYDQVKGAYRGSLQVPYVDVSLDLEEVQRGPVRLRVGRITDSGKYQLKRPYIQSVYVPVPKAYDVLHDNWEDKYCGQRLVPAVITAENGWVSSASRWMDALGSTNVMF